MQKSLGVALLEIELGINQGVRKSNIDREFWLSMLSVFGKVAKENKQNLTTENSLSWLFRPC